MAKFRLVLINDKYWLVLDIGARRFWIRPTRYRKGDCIDLV